MSEIGSLWEQIAPAGPACPPLDGDRKADLVVIGGGFLGLSTALHAAKAGLDTVLLEAQEAGFGASGRNTGFVVPSLKSALGPAEVTRLMGKEHAERLLRLVAGSGRTVFDLIEQHGMDVPRAQNGWLQPGHSAAADKMLKGRLPALLEAGVDADYLDRDQMQTLSGIPGLHGGLRVKSGGQINPLAYARGLARAAQAAGATIHAGSAATALTEDGAGWRVTTPGGTVEARQVLLATNAMTGNLSRPMRNGIVPVTIFQVATQVLPDEVRARILPAMAPVADTRRHTFALRWSEDGRLITGGMVVPFGNRMERARRGFLSRIRQFCPDLPPLRAAASWTGTIAATIDALPRMVRFGPGLYGAIGCNGRGVALTSALGAEIAVLMTGRTTEADFALPVTDPRPLPLPQLNGLAPHLWLPWSSLLDRIEAGRSATTHQDKKEL
ncbi:NAD(P)/FAD-dependent oxidoreductase [Pelagovum pacificum]|uniref:FAD-binding oxidoreductase n=1 Tax=Pelagovum pacificum TaxID=2588711 RepID=A0A5C5G9D4_9RHOB|nr:FAD-binding oxidoreductase [Pelagovum pacificum]QQA41969.1 FAD-binding oxidoreductase [Pelagovum pacificum]TNY30590.1 FAD-binding oxidoreductase [Pelagovum pacificum]